VVIALGSNLPGDYASSRDLLEAALAALEESGFRVLARSRWWRSASWPDPSLPAYLNGVALAATDHSAEAALEALHRIEADFGRARIEPNAPRPLDLDLVAYGRRVGQRPTTPHPRAHERRFVMGPLAEVAPEWRHPELRETAAALAEAARVGGDAEPV
jgi:2-amino-4-hydroxy-6-hydroxymethyldihydropteridine diphosphokinase